MGSQGFVAIESDTRTLWPHFRRTKLKCMAEECSGTVDASGLVDASRATPGHHGSFGYESRWK
jgi:hypothetical protein